MKISYEHKTKPRATGPRDESVRECISDDIGNSVTRNLHDFKCDTITRNRITPGDGCRMEVSTPPPMRSMYAGEYSGVYAPTIPASAIGQSKHLPAGKYFFGSCSGRAGGKAKIGGIHATISVVKLKTDWVTPQSGKNVKAVKKKNQRNVDVTLEPTGKGKISITGGKRTRCPGHHLVYQRTTLAGSLALISTQNAYYERGNLHVDLVVFNIGQRVGESHIPTWRTTPVQKRWLNKQRPWRTGNGNRG